MAVVHCPTLNCFRYHSDDPVTLPADGWGRSPDGVWLCPQCLAAVEQESRMHDDPENAPDLPSGHRTEQGLQFALDHLPQFYRGLYRRYVEQGFNEDQALRLVCAQIAGSLHK